MRESQSVFIRRKLGIAFLMILALGSISITLAQSDKRIEEIRNLYQEVNKKAAECEANGETSDTFLLEVVVNKNNGSYPAVGIYRSVIKFYYTYGDREKDPFPKRLLKIVVTTNRSAAVEVTEFLFNENGLPVFYFEKVDNEKRVYFDGGKPIRMIDGTKQLELKSKRATELEREINRRMQRLLPVFYSSLEN